MEEKIIVKSVESNNEKSAQEIEQELLNKANEPVDEIINETIDESVELSEEDVLSYFAKQGKEVSSLEALFAEKTSDPLDVPEEVATYLKYKEETGRGLKDFFKSNESIEDLDDDSLLSRYYSMTQSGLDSDDIQDLIDDQFSYDEDLDDEKDIKRLKRKKKQEISKAIEFLSDHKQKYTAPLESNGSGSAGSEEERKAYTEYIENAKTSQEAQNKKSEWFEKQTDELFTNDFKGFDFSIDKDKSITYSPSNITEVKDAQKNIGNFIEKFLDDKGMMKDTSGYHKALSMAMNPDAYAKFFYEQGMSDSVEGSAKSFKNTTLGNHKSPENRTKDASGIRAMNTDSGKGLKIKKRN
tara:strand:- start:695 stop:1756 length:1062 start_codon:yes stop_codon:yes gene_type:complete